MASDRLLAVQADAVSTTDWREMIRRTLDRFGRIGVLVNNHGAGVKIASIEEMSDEDIQTVLELRSEPFCSGQRPRNDRHPHKSVDP